MNYWDSIRFSHPSSCSLIRLAKTEPGVIEITGANEPSERESEREREKMKRSEGKATAGSHKRNYQRVNLVIHSVFTRGVCDRGRVDSSELRNFFPLPPLLCVELTPSGLCVRDLCEASGTPVDPPCSSWCGTGARRGLRGLQVLGDANDLGAGFLKGHQSYNGCRDKHPHP